MKSMKDRLLNTRTRTGRYYLNLSRLRYYLPFLLVFVFPFLSSGAQPDVPDVFRQVCAGLARAAVTSNSMAVAGNDGWLFLAGELRHVGAGQFWGEPAARVKSSPRG